MNEDGATPLSVDRAGDYREKWNPILAPYFVFEANRPFLMLVRHNETGVLMSAAAVCGSTLATPGTAQNGRRKKTVGSGGSAEHFQDSEATP